MNTYTVDLIHHCPHIENDAGTINVEYLHMAPNSKIQKKNQNQHKFQILVPNDFLIVLKKLPFFHGRNIFNQTWSSPILRDGAISQPRNNMGSKYLFP